MIYFVYIDIVIDMLKDGWIGGIEFIDLIDTSFWLQDLTILLIFEIENLK